MVIKVAVHSVNFLRCRNLIADLNWQKYIERELTLSENFGVGIPAAKDLNSGVT